MREIKSNDVSENARQCNSTKSIYNDPKDAWSFPNSLDEVRKISNLKFLSFYLSFSLTYCYRVFQSLMCTPGGRMSTKVRVRFCGIYGPTFNA